MTLTSLLNNIVYHFSLLGMSGLWAYLGFNKQEGVVIKTLHKTNTAASNPTTVDMVRSTRRALLLATGFTIIEVLIVLAIAGLILLIVFLAVPALQRNNRNTQRKVDVSKMLGAISEYASLNGKLPVDQTTLQTALSNASYGFYTASSVLYKSGAQTNPKDDSVWVVFQAICSSGDAVSNSNQRAIAVLFSNEAPGVSFNKSCQNS